MSHARKAVAAGEGCPKRFVVTYLGTSVSNCYRYQSYPGGRYDLVTPLKEGPGYQSTLGLEPIFKAGVQDVMGAVTGLKIPVLGANRPPSEPAGIGFGFHGRSSWPQLCGTSVLASDSTDFPAGASADQLILDTISGDTLKRFPKGLQLSVSPLYKQTLSYDPPKPG